ncbi:hypothetical protein NDS46_31600 (plasmid) [Paenibacillus thiaminolyticus]|uniref:hypothetical protein n=1 Tax=Paenibacillus thiaminolyticus TaxID=49283 RepID=UPI00232E6C76|nr:hypothetical protein [Paenibacillus thiaminolyticus]WCF11504.1 hypothetical protein NDS46_31600 [Paenibacillus thiaminolyticus]
MVIGMYCENQYLGVKLSYPIIGETVHVDFGRGFSAKKVYTNGAGESYFLWNKSRMYFEYLREYTMESIQERLDNKKHIMSYELILAIINDGINHVRFICPCNKRSKADIFGLGVFTSETENVACKIHEENWKLEDNYKISIIPEFQEYQYAGRDYYIEDFLSLLKSGHIKILHN